MSNESISALTSASSVSTASSSSTTKLSAATKSKLEAMGIDTTNITTEVQGQTALKAAELKKEAAAQKAGGAQGNSSEASIKADAKSLASQVGASVADDDSIDDIMSKISSKIRELRASAGTDESKLAEIEGYQTQLDSISSTYSAMQTSQAQLSSSMSGLASYNKASLNL